MAPSLCFLKHANAPIFRVSFVTFVVLYSCHMMIKPCSQTIQWIAEMSYMKLVDFADGFPDGVTAVSSAAVIICCDWVGSPNQTQSSVVQPFIVIMEIV